jgi:virulence-associated protein VapD
MIDNKNYPLHAAIQEKNLESLKQILNKCSNIAARTAIVNSLDQYGRTPLYLAAACQDSYVAIQATKFLLEAGANPNTESNHSPLYDVVSRGAVALAQLLLQQGADPDIRGDNGQTPLMRAVGSGNEAMIRLLLPYADATLQDDQKNTAVHYAIDRAAENILYMLLSHPKLNPNAKNAHGETLVDYAIYKYSLTMYFAQDYIETQQTLHEELSKILTTLMFAGFKTHQEGLYYSAKEENQAACVHALQDCIRASLGDIQDEIMFTEFMTNTICPSLSNVMQTVNITEKHIQGIKKDHTLPDLNNVHVLLSLCHTRVQKSALFQFSKEYTRDKKDLNTFKDDALYSHEPQNPKHDNNAPRGICQNVLSDFKKTFISLLRGNYREGYEGIKLPPELWIEIVPLMCKVLDFETTCQPIASMEIESQYSTLSALTVRR